MYRPASFDEKRVDVMHAFIRKHPLGAVITSGSAGVVASHVPIEIDASPAPLGMLSGHFARANPAWREHDGSREALVIFQGPEAYISPSWYPSKREGGKVVPTWNYAVVHAYGPLHIVDDVEWLRRFVHRLTDRHESGVAEPWSVGDAPADYIEKLLPAIVGFEIPITRLEGKWKMGQNRTVADRRGAAAGLRREGGGGAADVADIMDRL